MSLAKYRQKRNFRRTPEPRGRRPKQSALLQFVVQKHAASHLHYDFRLELDGVLKSWAVPKGPSLDPSVKSLAVEVEDHPLEYGSFEGIIPPGEYGGGTVMVWDRGTWEPEGDPHRGMKQGRLTFELFGEKLHGGWSLVRMRNRNGDKNNWLLIKRSDDEARRRDGDLLAKQPQSALSGRTLEEIAEDADQVWNGSKKMKSPKESPAKKQRPSKKGKSARTQVQDLADLPGARKGVLPRTWKPQLATLTERAPEGENWLHEIKLDGYRMVAFVREGDVHLRTRTGGDWTNRFGPVRKAVAELGLGSGLLDGEVVCLNEKGVSDFQLLQNWLKEGGKSPLVYYVFDLPYVEGFDLTRTPLADRKEALARIVLAANPRNSGSLRYNDHLRGSGQTVIDQSCRLGLEGIVSKQADSVYTQGRTRTWLKTKCRLRQEFVIGGFTKPSGARTAFGALLLGYYEEDDLIYCGRVGTGFTEASLRQVDQELKKHRTDDPPFANPPTGADRRGVTWVKPQLVAEVEFAQWTQDGILRQAAFQGLRQDKPPRQVTREEVVIEQQKRPGNGRAKSSKRSKRAASAPKAVKPKDQSHTIAGVRITHPDRVVFPEQGLTKLELARFYESIADWILPGLAGRPLSLVRCPEGRAGECFYQKNWPAALPPGVETVSIQEKRKRSNYIMIRDLTGLIGLVQFGVLEFHPWLAKADAVEQPDQLIFDLDPGPGVRWAEVIHAAVELRSRLKTHRLQCFVRTSGGKGLHVVAPLTGKATWADLKAFGKSLAESMAADEPNRYVSVMTKSKRQGKIFVDYLRNQRGATAVASYSTRARRSAPVATPVRWDELNARLRPDKYNVSNLAKRLAALKGDPWKGFFQIRQSLRGVR